MNLEFLMTGDAGRACKLHSLPSRSCSVVSLPRPRVHSNFARARERAQKTAEETKVGVNRDWRAMKHFRAALVIYYDVAGTFLRLARRDAFRTVLVVFYYETAV